MKVAQLMAQPLRRSFRVALLAAALLLLTGCGQLSPGTAATVNDQRITMQAVRDLADAQCAAAENENQGQGGAAMPKAQVQQRSLGLLMEIELTRQFAADQKLEPDDRIVDAFWTQYRQPIQALPAQSAEVLTDVFGDFAEIRALLVRAGSEATGQAPSPDNLQQLTEAGLQARQQWLDDAEIHTDAAFAPDADGYPGNGDSSVSRPVSDFAKSATSPQPDPEWVSGLPAGQRCG